MTGGVMRTRQGEAHLSRVTVSLPTELLDAVDQKLVKENETRSALIRRLLERALRETEERREIERYVQGYLEQPQTEAEVAWSEETLQNLEELPWKPRA
jgi:metal-responsive CopG/Arc/MetJ family transcriptional regulator